MSNKVRILIVIVLVIAGIGVMVYPSLSNYINTIHSSYAVQELSQQLNSVDTKMLEQQRQLAEAYNDNLTGMVEDAFSEDDTADRGDYEKILDFGNGIMGYIQIPKIGVELSIYHGVSDAVLQKGVGHMPDSAFPIGGPGNHAVLTGHTGLPSAELFTDLTELEEGDMFYITILGETLAYEVDQIVVVLPYEVEELVPSRGRDYCTLVTCTPYGINSHRLLVRGERVQMDQKTIKKQVASVSEESVKMPTELILAIASVAVLLVIALIVLLKPKKKEEPQNSTEEHDSPEKKE